MTITVNIDKEIPNSLYGDEQRLTQALTNLVNNAVKFTPENGNIIIDIKFLGEENGNCIIQIEVSDTGIGINPEKQKKLFQSFQQAENSTTRKFGGTGLGLAITKNIIEMMDGKVWINSELGKGSTFGFTIQMKRSADTSNENVNIDQQQSEESISGMFANRNILLVEDVDINREIVIAFLEPTLIKIDCAKDGLEAVKMFSENPENYDLIFMDIQMPEMDGYEATRCIRELNVKNSKDIPIVAMTANVFKEDIEKCLESGMNEHIGKPISFNEILDILKKYIK